MRASSLASDGCLSGGHNPACLSVPENPLHQVEHRCFEFGGGSAYTASVLLTQWEVCSCSSTAAFVQPSLSAASYLVSCSPVSGRLSTGNLPSRWKTGISS